MISLDAGPAIGPARDEGPGDGTQPITVRLISAAEHATFAASGSHSFLQTPAWGAVKAGWRPQSLGWFHGDRLVGSALVLYRAVPGTRRSLAYVPEGPCLPWQQVGTAPGTWLGPFVAHLRAEGAFAIRIGPQQILREWTAATAKRGLADPAVRRFAQLPADTVHPAGQRLTRVLSAEGFRSLDEAAGEAGSGAGFGAGQPSFTVRIPLPDRTDEELLASANQQWRRNVARAVKAGVVVQEGSRDDLGTFHRLYRETADRDGFTPRPASYFTGMWDALHPAIRLYVARLDTGGEPEPLAAALMIRSGSVCWYVYGASSSRHRDAQASTALQWQAIRDARAGGCTSYDLRGIADTLDPAEPISGLLRFKLNTSGVCTQTAGEWELVLSPLWHKAFQTYLRIRS